MSTEKLREVVGEIAGDLVALRRALHREPEVGLELPATQARILDALAGLGLWALTRGRLGKRLPIPCTRRQIVGFWQRCSCIKRVKLFPGVGTC